MRIEMTMVMRWASRVVFAGVAMSGLLGEDVARARPRPVPPGSYQQTCSEISLSHGTLTATCRTVDQRPRRSSLPRIAWCTGDISNNNGQLECNRGDLPAGSYLQSCQHAQMRGNTLVASCRTIRGDWSDTSLRAISECEGDIGNNDGRLTCAR